MTVGRVYRTCPGCEATCGLEITLEDDSVEVTDSVRLGVVSLPHGWGHDIDGALEPVS